MAAEATAARTSASFWENDDAWSVAWPAAIAFAMLFHGFAFIASENAPQRVKQEPITMAIAMPPPPPEPPPPPPPEPEKPKPPPPKVKPPDDIPPPPNDKPVDEPVKDVVPVTGLSADSVVADSNVSARVGNTTFGNPNDEKFTPPQEVQKPQASPFDLTGYRRALFDAMNHEKRYPRKARVLGLEGRCIVKLVLNRDGSLAEDPKLLGKGTGHDVLDEECLRMAKDAKRPPIVGDVELPVHVTQAIDFRVIDP